MEKKRSNKIHFKRRMQERYGIEIKQTDIGYINEIISLYKADYSEKETVSRLRCLIDFYGQIVYIVYDLKRKIPLTALPREKFFDMWRIR